MPEEYVIPLSIDVAGIIQKASTTKTALSDVGEAAKKAGNEAKTGFDNAAKGSQDLSTKLVDNSTKYGQLTKSVEQLKIQLQSYQNVAAKSLDPKVITEYNSKVDALKSQISQLSNAGKQGFNELGQAVEKNSNFLTSAFSKVRQLAYILPGVGIAGILAFFTGPIIEYISKLDFVKKGFETLTVAQKDYQQAFQDTDYQKAISNVSELTENISLAKQGFLDKTKVLKQYNDTLGASIGYAGSLDEAEQKIVRNGKDYIQVTLLKAASQIALNDAIKKTAEAAQIAAKPTDTFVSFKSEALQTLNLLAQGRFTKDVRKAQKEDQDQQVKDLQDSAKQQIAVRDKLQKDAAALAKKNGQIDFFDGTEDPDKQAKQKKAFDTQTNFLNQLLKLQNDYRTASIAGIEDETTRLVEQNYARYQNQIDTLENQKKLDKIQLDNKKLTSDQYETLLRQINLNIAQIQKGGEAETDRIIAEGNAKKLLAQQNSLRAIGVLLKDETDARIEAIRANYAKVTAEAKKNGSLTDALEKKLINQRESDISDVQSKAVIDRLNEQESLKEALIKTESQKSGETQKQYENRIQQELLDVVIEFAKKRVEVLAATLAINGSLTAAQTKELSKSIEAIRNATNKKTDNKVPEKRNIFEVLGINDIDAGKLQDAFQKTTDSLSGIFSGLAEMADRSVQAIQKQIDAIDQLLQADQDAVDKQQALSDKGRANSLDAAKKKLADDQKLKEQLQKQEEKAQKKKQDLQRAALAADSIQQVSGLITSSVNIFESLSKIPFIGIPLAIATIGAMFAAFGVAKANAFSAVNSQSAEDGGVAGGDRHSNGGNKYVSMDGKDTNILEIEKGERIFSRKNSEKHKRLFEAIQNNDYSKLDINDVSISDLLRGTGVMSQLEVARNTGNSNITLQDRANNVVIVANNSDKYLSSIDKKMDNLHRKEPIVIDFGDYIWIDYGNGHTERKFK